MRECVILVDEGDNEIGTEEKIKAHTDGRLHRAFSIYCINSRGEMLIQKRAKGKYHSGALWTNACCGHPRPRETLQQATHRRLEEEMGFDCELRKAFSFTYKVFLDNCIIENEFDHVFIGVFDGEPNPNTNEVEDYRFMSIRKVRENMKKNPENFTYWFRLSLERVVQYLNRSFLLKKQ